MPLPILRSLPPLADSAEIGDEDSGHDCDQKDECLFHVISSVTGSPALYAGMKMSSMSR